MSILDKHLVLLTLLQRNFTTMGMFQLLLQALRAPHSILEAAAATTAEGSSTQAAAPGGALRRRFASAVPPPSAAGYRALSQEWM